MSSPAKDVVPAAGGIADDVALDSGGARLTLYTILLVATLVASVLINAYQGRRLSALRTPIDELKETIRGLTALADAESSELRSLVVSAPVQRPLSWGWAEQSKGPRAAVLEVRDGDAWKEQRRAAISSGRHWISLRFVELRVGAWKAQLDVRPMNDAPNSREPPVVDPLELSPLMDEALSGDQIAVTTLDEPSFGADEVLLTCSSKDGEQMLRVRLVSE